MLADKLTQLRKDREKTQEEVASYLGITRPTYTGYESGRRQPDYTTLVKLAEFFNVSTDFLLGVKQLPSQKEHASTIPILRTIRAGIPILAEDNWEGEVDVPAKLKAEFALRVTGDSMSWAGIHEGDLAILKRTDNASPGMIVAAGVEESTWSATLKYYVKDNGQAVLRAANPEYKDVAFTADHRVIGYTVAVLKDPPPYNTYKNLLMRKDLTDRKWHYAVELAQQAGLDGEQVGNLISMFMTSVKTFKKN